MPADDRLWPENCNRAEDGREPTIEPRAGRLDELKCHPTVKPVALVADDLGKVEDGSIFCAGPKQDEAFY